MPHKSCLGVCELSDDTMITMVGDGNGDGGVVNLELELGRVVPSVVYRKSHDKADSRTYMMMR